MKSKVMTFSHKTTLATILLTSLPIAQAEVGNPFEFSANVALTSDYVFRGISQTDEGFAIQGGFDVAHETGFSMGTWASNVKYLEDNTVNPEDRADIEIDLYVGYDGKWGDGGSYGIKAGRYSYPGAGSHLNYDFNEFNIHLGYATPEGIELGFAYDYAPEVFGDVGAGHHYVLTLGQKMPSGLGFNVHVGQLNFSDNDKAGDDYIYYGASLSFPIANFDAALSYSDTDLDNAKSLNADDRIFFTLSKSF